ncbi:MAG: glycosyltransferase family 2 protein [bacterium]
MNNDLVSIITPLYNSKEFIEETIQSVLNQSYREWEMIIVDDCSTDDSVQIVQEFIKKDDRIKLIQLNENSGTAIARNKGIKNAKGRYIAFLDSDDLWHPEKIKKQINFMNNNNYAFTFTNYQQISSEGKINGKCINAPKKLNYQEALYSNYIGCLTAIYDVKQLGKVYMPLLRKRQDYGLWLKILKKINYGFGLDQCLAYYRVRKNSISSNKIGLLKYQWQLYRDIENLPLLKSLFYISYTIMLKLLK